MPHQVAMIVIDTGFSEESLAGAPVLAFFDLASGRTASGAPYLDGATLSALSGDPHGHGSIVLQRLREQAPEAPLVLVKAYPDGPDARLIRTGWANGRQTTPGWTEAYLAAVELCRQRGLLSVANCSFGGFLHAGDGTGWESFQLGKATGEGKAGHVVVAAAGPGDGRAAHSSWLTPAGGATTVKLFQQQTGRYNLWAAPGADDWVLEVFSRDGLVQRHVGSEIPENFWNGRRQLTFYIEGSGLFELRLSRRESEKSGAVRFDCWAPWDDSSAFLNHIDPVLIAEPAVFPQVIAVGLATGKYSPRQALPEEKPDVLIEGGGPISFRLPEVVAAVARLLSDNPELDVTGVRKLLGKHPHLG